MFSSLDRVDMRIASSKRIRCLQTDHRPAAEIQQHEELSTLFALTRVLGPLARRAADEVVYVCAEPPPDFLRRAVASAGGSLQVQKGPVLVYEGLLGHPEELADDTFRRLAYRVLRERNAALEESALVALQQELLPAPDKEENEPIYWTRLIELAAVTGELLRAKFGGRWVATTQGAPLPFLFQLGAEDSSRYLPSNVAGKVERFLGEGARASPVELLLSVEEKPRPVPKPVLLMLKAAEWPGHDTVACQPLLPWKDTRVAIPWLTYGEDLPNSFGHLPKDSPQALPLDALHAQALENLKALEVEVVEINQSSVRLLAVLGPFYATEKVLDADFMRGLQERLGSPSLVAAIPRRGFFFVMSARVKPLILRVFLGMCEAQYRQGESEPLCPTPLLIEDGKISGFLWARRNGAAKLIRATEPNTTPLRGFFSQLFGWKTS